MNIQNQKNPTKVKKTETHISYLTKHIGKRIKIEYLTPNSNNEIYGQLIKVGEDFISIKLPSTPLSTVIFKIDKIIKVAVIFE